MPVVGIVTSGAKYGAGLPGRRPQLHEIAVDGSFCQLSGVTFVAAPRANRTCCPSGTSIDTPTMSSHWRSTPIGCASSRTMRAGDPGTAGKGDVHSLGICRTHQAIDPSVVETIKIPVEVPVFPPGDVQLPAAGVHDLIQQHLFHKGQRSLSAPVRSPE